VLLFVVLKVLCNGAKSRSQNAEDVILYLIVSARLRLRILQALQILLALLQHIRYLASRVKDLILQGYLLLFIGIETNSQSLGLEALQLCELLVYMSEVRFYFFLNIDIERWELRLDVLFVD